MNLFLLMGISIQLSIVDGGISKRNDLKIAEKFKARGLR